MDVAHRIRTIAQSAAVPLVLLLAACGSSDFTLSSPDIGNGTI